MSGGKAWRICREWRLAHCAPERLDPQTWGELEWRAATVPSNVQTSAYGLPVGQLYAGDRIGEVAWMEARCWLYRTAVDIPAVAAEEEAVFVLKGVDYRCAVYANGERVLDREGMFSPIELALPAGRHELVVVIFPFDKGAEPYETLKARYSFGDGWDFAPRLRSAGIWDEAGVLVRRKLRVTSAYVDVRLANRQRAEVTVFAELSEAVASGAIVVRLGGAARRFPLVHGGGRLALPLHVPSPPLWWPNGLGEPQLTELTLELDVPGRETAPFVLRVGLRAVERVPCHGQGQEDAPLQLRVNGRSVFLKGVNWVPADACPADVDEARYRLFLERFREAGVNFVRVWGGGLKEKDVFYDIADELGLMVMQEFPLACQLLARTERFYALLEQEGAAIVRGLRHHASLVLWSGGNEHYHYWDAVDSGAPEMERAKPVVRRLFGIAEDSREWLAGAERYDEPALALLGALCARLDGTRPFQITSALEGEGEVHGIWSWNPRIGDHRYRDYASAYDFWLQADRQLYSEASVSSIANLATIGDVLGVSAVEAPGLPLPGRTDPVWRLHHAFGSAWDGLDDLWLDIPSAERLFGRFAKLEELVFASQWMQADMARFLVEELRRKQGCVAGVVWWGVNEPWPGLAGNALLDYFGRPKLGWSFLANAFRPTIASLRYGHCVTRAVKPDLWISHDGTGTFAGRYEAELIDIAGGAAEKLGGSVVCGAGEAVYVRTLPRTRLAAGKRLHIRLRLFDAGGSEMHRNDYVFASDEEVAPFGGEMTAYMRDLYIGK
ncbi:MAG: hypothetical protein J7639_09680 [Paenibacillaceae bacterium]|nr:hypothetical protein [Paenibacillaceae bacterium]